MNKKYFNGKYNLISNFEVDFDIIPKNVVFRKGNVEEVSFKIRKEELENDEVYSGNILLNDKFSIINFKSIFKMSIDDRTIYADKYLHTPYPKTCFINTNYLICSSFVLWIISRNFNKHDKTSLYSLCRAHRIRVDKAVGVNT